MKRKVLLLAFAVVFAASCVLTLIACKKVKTIDNNNDGIISELENSVDDPFEYFPLPDGSYSVAAGRSKYLETVVIPKEHNGKPVTVIALEGFKDSPNLKNVTIPDSITSIGGSAFSGCSSLTTIKFGENSQLTSIGDSLFSGCSSLTSIEIPDSVTSIGKRAFSGCGGLTSLIIENGVMGIGESAFYDCLNLKRVYYNGDIAGWCNIAFDNEHSNPLYYAHNLYVKDNNEYNLATSGELSIPDGVSELKQYAFLGCSTLTGVTIPDSVTSIGRGVFSGCSIENATIPANACSCVNNDKLKTVVITSGESINDSAFWGCGSLVSVVIPDSVLRIEDYAFYGCWSLAGMIMSDGVTSIGDYAFSCCSSMTSVAFGEKSRLTIIGDGAFDNCDSLMSIIIPDGVTSMGEKTFCGCGRLTSVTIGNSVTSIGEEAFSRCSSLTTIIIPDGVTSIEKWAFDSCRSLTSIVIPDSVTSIDSGAFAFCHNLTRVYYYGSEGEWLNINIYDDSIMYAERYYYSEIEPAAEGNFWHYEGGEIVVW